jgi:hypothetical protein
VKEVRESGVLILQGKDGAVIEENVVNCAPCHLPIVNPVIDWGYYKVPLNLPCRVCISPAREASMLICDGCQAGWHKGCLDPPLKRVPRGNWFCPECVRKGKDQQWIGPMGEPQEPLGEQVVVQRRRGRPPKRGIQEDQLEAAVAVLVDAVEGLYSVMYEDRVQEQLSEYQVYLSAGGQQWYRANNHQGDLAGKSGLWTRWSEHSSCKPRPMKSQWKEVQRVLGRDSDGWTGPS